MPALFMTSQTQSDGDKIAAIAVVFCGLADVDLIFFFFNQQDRELIERKNAVNVLFIPFQSIGPAMLLNLGSPLTSTV